jgi:hypothetical protein
MEEINEHRVEVVINEPRLTLAVAQFYAAGDDDTDFTGWVVSGESTDLFTGPIETRREALDTLEQRSRRELRLYQRFPEQYPYVPEEALDPRDNHRNATHLPD